MMARHHSSWGSSQARSLGNILKDFHCKRSACPACHACHACHACRKRSVVERSVVEHSVGKAISHPLVIASEAEQSPGVDRDCFVPKVLAMTSWRSLAWAAHNDILATEHFRVKRARDNRPAVPLCVWPICPGAFGRLRSMQARLGKDRPPHHSEPL